MMSTDNIVRAMTRKIVAGLLFMFLACGLHAQQGSATTERVKCVADSSQQYALYLPEHFDGLLIFFDPGARGNIPVEKYRSLADAYGLAMAGSYSSRNFSLNSSVDAFVAIYNDIVRKYAIDTARIWVSGFSGGARAAATIGMHYPEIKGVIGCGAGFATPDPDLSTLPKYVSIVGNMDMNFSELFDNNAYLDERNIDNLFLTFRGEHEWPPVDRFAIALAWLSGMNPKSSAVEPGTRFLQSIEQKIKGGRLFDAAIDAKALSKLDSFNHLAKKYLSDLRSASNFLTDSLFFVTMIRDEQRIMNEFSTAFTKLISDDEKVDEEKWRSYAGRVGQTTTNDDRRRESAGRCLNHFSLVCQEYCGKLLSEHNYPVAYKSAKVLSIIKPKSPDGFFLMAKISADLNDKKDCVENLTHAFLLGLSLNDRVRNAVKAVLTENDLNAIFRQD